jgi:hypothetical protein
MIGLLFIMHMIGTAATVIYVAAATVAVIRQAGSAVLLEKCAGGVAAVQVASGLGLAFLSPSVSLPAVCLRGVLLVGFLALMQMAVRWRLAPGYLPDSRL